jgi:methylthioribose-1-phosphate isomerase
VAEIAPLVWRDGELLVLDQRRLPEAEDWVRCRSAADVAECIRSMAVRGAPAIGIAAAYGVALAARGGEDVRAAADLLRGTRPTAVNLVWAVDQAAEADDPLSLAERLHQEQLEADRRMSELGAERFADGDRALTHCNTGPLATGGLGTAGGVLRAAWERGRLSQVWVDETRPRLQGARLTAWELDAAGIPHTLIADSAAGGLLAAGAVDCVFVGADRIAANGDTANKVGTYPLAVLAARHEVPFYVVAPSSSVDLGVASGAEIPIEQRDPAEVSSRFPAWNPAFDVTPAELIAAIVTEHAVHRAPYAESLAQAVPA